MPDFPMLTSFQLPPQEAIDYLKNKGFRLTFDHNELLKEAHHKAFTVAKVTRADLLLDLHNALIQAQTEGQGFDDFKKNLKPLLKEKGWWGETEVTDPKTGEVKTIHVNARRLHTIFHTNMRVSYNVGRYQQMKQLKSSVYWYYASALLPTTRDSHRARHGTVKHRDDDWWTLNYPPNGWGCHCKVRAYSKKELEKKGLSVDESKLPDLATGDWAYDIGAGSRVGKLVKLDLDQSLEQLPISKKDQKLDDLTEQELMDRFFKEMGIQPRDMVLDPIGDPMIIDEELFRTGSGAVKIKKFERHIFLLEMARTIQDPDEIFLEVEALRDSKGSRLVKKMFRYFYSESRKKAGAVIAIFKYDKDKTQGASVYYITSSLEQRRKGKIVYQKDHSTE